MVARASIGYSIDVVTSYTITMRWLMDAWRQLEESLCARAAPLPCVSRQQQQQQQSAAVDALFDIRCCRRRDPDRALTVVSG